MRAVLPILVLGMLAGCGSQEPAANSSNVTVAKPIAGPKLGSVDLNQPLRAFGTEPFWTLDVAPGDMSYTDYALANPRPEPFFPHAPVVTGDKAVWTTKNVADAPVVLTLTRKDCLEAGEDDQTQPLTAELRIGDKVRTGCAGPKPKEEPEGDNASNAVDAD